MVRKAGYRVIELILLIRNYGFINGFSIWMQLVFSFKSVVTLKAKLFKNNVYLRKKDSDLSIFHQVFTERQYRWPGVETLNPKTILDAGGNIGMASLYFAGLFPECKIFTVEPDSDNFQAIRKNTINYPNIKSLQAGVWYTNEPLEITRNEGLSAGLVLKTAEETAEKVNGYTIDKLMELFQIDYIDILKIDVEGAEKEIFEKGDINWLSKVGIIVIELHDLYKEGTANAFFNAINNKFSKIYFQGENVICFLKK